MAETRTETTGKSDSPHVRRVVTALRAEAKRYDAAAAQQDHMAEWTSRTHPATRSRERAFLFREAAQLLELMTAPVTSPRLRAAAHAMVDAAANVEREYPPYAEAVATLANALAGEG